MFKKLLSITALAAASFTLSAQVTSTPPLLQEGSPDVVIYFHADQGNKGLMGQPASAQIYAHTGVITNASVSSSDWKYAPNWGDNSAKYKLEYVSADLWKLDIGDIRSYYGITDPSVSVKRLAFVFRNSTCTAEGKGTGNTDIFLDVLPEGLQVSLSADTDGTVLQPHSNVSLTLRSSQAADLTLSVNGSTIGSASGKTELTAKYSFAQSGNYTVTGTATAGGKTVTKSIEYVCLAPSTAADYPGGKPVMGAVRNGDGSVTFCIAAPQKQTAMLVGSWNGYATDTKYTMAYQDYEGNRYFWITVPGLERGKDYMYYYLIDGTTKVGDPYARLILDPNYDRYIAEGVFPDMPAYPDAVSDVPLAVFNDNINDYDWQVSGFKGAEASNLFIYELLLRDFTGTEGQAYGNGNVRLAMEKIPYLKQLGVNAVELMPITEFNGNNSWGYNPNFYFAPDKAYGTPADYKAFIDECHRNGIAVILDMVFNQSDWLHPWYQMYPIGSNPFFNASAPHAYSVLNDWNQGNPLVRQYFCDVLQYWLTEYRVDGFRFDLVKGLGDNSSYNGSGDSATEQFNQSRIDNMRRFQQAVTEVNPDAYFINENLASPAEENAMAEYGQLNWANVNYSGSQYAAGLKDNSGLNRFYAPADSRNWGSTVSYLESHDEQRLAYVQNTSGATGIKGNIVNSMHRLGSAAAQMMMSPGAHMIWQFSELGNAQNTKNSGGNNTDPKTVNWKHLDNANRHGLYNSYAELAAIRNNNPQMFSRDVQVTVNTSASYWNNGRSIVLNNGNQQILLAVNPNIDGEPINVSVPFKSSDNADYQVLSKSYDTDPTYNAAAGYITVAPNCYAVIGSADMTEVESIASDSTRLTVSGSNGTLTIARGDGGIAVYTPAGLCVYRADSAATDTVSLTLPSGIYIVRAMQGGTARTVKVRI